MKRFKSFITELETSQVLAKQPGDSEVVKTRDKQRQELQDLKSNQKDELERARRDDFDRREQDRKRADSDRENVHRAVKTQKDYLQYSKVKEENEQSGNDEGNS